MTARSYLSIGDVLTLLRQEFPDVTISKIRFLESQGLVNPERTPSGYRKFYEHDVERLRWVLRQQREHFLPLKVIKDRLDDGSESGTGSEAAASEGTAAPADKEAAPADGAAAPADGPPEPAAQPVEEPVLVGQRTRTDATDSASSGDVRGDGILLSGTDIVHPVTATSGSGPVGLRLASDRHAAPGAREATTRRAGVPMAGRPMVPDVTNAADVGDDASNGEGSLHAEPAPPPAPAPASESAAAPPRRSSSSRPGRAGSTAVAADVPVTEAGEEPAMPATPAGDDGTTLSVEELSVACGLDVAVLGELQEFGLLVPRAVAGVPYFDEEALAVALLAARFAQFGIEPRHLRLYKNAADREAGFVEQILLPLVRQRNPEARARAQQTADDLAGLGQQLRGALLRRALADLLGV